MLGLTPWKDVGVSRKKDPNIDLRYWGPHHRKDSQCMETAIRVLLMVCISTTDIVIILFAVYIDTHVYPSSTTKLHWQLLQPNAPKDVSSFAAIPVKSGPGAAGVDDLSDMPACWDPPVKGSY